MILTSRRMSALVPYFIFCSILCFSLIQRAGGSEQKLKLPPICSLKCQKNINDTQTGIYCNAKSNLKLSGRCCVATAGLTTVLGIDLQQCGVTEETFSNGIENMTDLLYISLQGNNITKLTSEDFHRNTKIIYLSLPQGVDCPGGSNSWNETSNSTSKLTICRGELNTCPEPDACPDNSHCVPSGIGLFECLCKDGYHGYKCMNQGTFPTLEFALSIAIPTVIISALLWVTQRRYVKANNKNK